MVSVTNGCAREEAIMPVLASLVSRLFSLFVVLLLLRSLFESRDFRETVATYERGCSIRKGLASVSLVAANLSASYFK